MRKFGLLSLALVLVLGSLGIGYAAWTDTIFINGTVGTGSVCIEWIKVSDYDDCPHGPPWYVGEGDGDPNLDLYAVTNHSWAWPLDPFCEYYAYDTDKNVACTEVQDLPPPSHSMLVTIYNAYPLYYQDMQVELRNCGDIPVIIYPPEDITFEALNFTFANYPWNPEGGTFDCYDDEEWNDGEIFVQLVDGEEAIQLEPGEKKAFSFIIIVQQSAEQNRGNGSDPYQFLITVDAIQWNEFVLPGGGG
jgi:hypothetical protein